MKTSNKKILISFIFMIAAIIAVCFLANIDKLYATPLLTPKEFLKSMPYVNLALFGQDIIFIQPSSSFFVYFLGIITSAYGIWFVAHNNQQNSRKFWGIGMILWGISALVAGTSYQAFGYMLKCAGETYTLFTSKWELVYMLLTCYCINYLLIAVAKASTTGKLKSAITIFTICHATAYSLIMIIASSIPVEGLISYFGFVKMHAANFILMFVISLIHYLRHKDILSRNFVFVWLLFIVVNVGYFAWLGLGMGTYLNTNYHFWFNENDMLHVLMILWMTFDFFALKNHLNDVSVSDNTHPQI